MEAAPKANNDRCRKGVKESMLERDENTLFFIDLSVCVKNYLSEDSDTGSSLLEMVCHSPQRPFCRRFFDRFGETPFIAQVLVLILASHFQQRGPAAWRIPSKISDNRRDILRQETGRLLRDGSAVAMPEDSDLESRAEGGVPLMLSLDVAAYMFEGLDCYINFAECFSSCGRWVLSKDIHPKNLFYGAGIKDDIMRLEKAISTKGYDATMARLSEHSLCSGLSVMLYGPPGTGKTELVWQLARLCGRNVVAADIAKLTGSYVGEAERSYRSLFNSYKYAARIMKTIPILLLNEADCFLISRMSVTRSSDKYENNVQSVLLEELETFEGILFATTNHTQNMDPAFDRRFLFKLKIDLPDTDARVRIWHEVFPELAEADVAVLADSYRLSGSQIRNVAEQVIIRKALDGRKVSFEDISKICREVEQGVIGAA